MKMQSMTFLFAKYANATCEINVAHYTVVSEYETSLSVVGMAKG